MKSTSKIALAAGFLALLLGAWLFTFPKSVSVTNTPRASRELLSTQQDNIDVERAYLYDLEGTEAYAMARRAYTPGQFVFALEANMTGADVSANYAVWLINSAEDKIFLGNLQKTEQNFYLEYHSDKNLRDYPTVKVLIDDGTNIKEKFEGKFDGEN
jgi:hypothetical protein